MGENALFIFLTSEDKKTNKKKEVLFVFALQRQSRAVLQEHSSPPGAHRCEVLGFQMPRGNKVLLWCKRNRLRYSSKEKLFPL